MKIVVLDAATLGDDIELSALESFGLVEIYQTTDAENVAKRIADCDVVIINKVKLYSENLAYAKNLKLICVAATGFDNIDIKYCKENNIAICNVVGYSTDSVAQITVALALSLINHLPEYTEYIKDGSYSAGNVANRLIPVYHELSSKVWGIVGLGNIGRKVAQIARAFGCRVIACKRTPDKEFECVDIDTLCKNADIISIHVPMSEATRELINRERIGMMKRDAIVVNVARGAVTDEKALAQAIKNHKLGGLGSDVYSSEPFRAEHPFYEIRNFNNVCLTPHMAWGAYEARVRCVNEICANIEAFLKGERRNRVDL